MATRKRRNKQNKQNKQNKMIGGTDHYVNEHFSDTMKIIELKRTFRSLMGPANLDDVVNYESEEITVAAKLERLADSIQPDIMLKQEYSSFTTFELVLRHFRTHYNVELVNRLLNKPGQVFRLETLFSCVEGLPTVNHHMYNYLQYHMEMLSQILQRIQMTEEERITNYYYIYDFAVKSNYPTLFRTMLDHKFIAPPVGLHSYNPKIQYMLHELNSRIKVAETINLMKKTGHNPNNAAPEAAEMMFDELMAQHSQPPFQEPFQEE